MTAKVLIRIAQNYLYSKLDQPMSEEQMFKYTKYLLDKIQDVFKEIKYTVRYEKGSFQSGYCIVDDKNIIVINKFFDTEARINCLLDILDKVDFDRSELSDGAKKTLKKLDPVMNVGVSEEE